MVGRHIEPHRTVCIGRDDDIGDTNAGDSSRAAGTILLTGAGTFDDIAVGILCHPQCFGDNRRVNLVTHCHEQGRPPDNAISVGDEIEVSDTGCCVFQYWKIGDDRAVGRQAFTRIVPAEGDTGFFCWRTGCLAAVTEGNSHHRW